MNNYRRNQARLRIGTIAGRARVVAVPMTHDIAPGPADSTQTVTVAAQPEPPSEPPEWFCKLYGDYLGSEEGQRLYGDKPLGEPVKKFEDTFSAETVVMEKFFPNTLCPKLGAAQWTCTKEECTCHRKGDIK